MRVVLGMLVLFTITWLALLIVDAVGMLSTEVSARLLLILTVLPVVVVVLYSRRHGWLVRPDRSWSRVRVKALAIASLLCLMLLYSALMTWSGLAPFANFYIDMAALLPVLLLILPLYVSYVDRRLKDPEDDYYRFGLVLLGRRVWIFSEQKQFLLAAFVKILFIPAMYSGLIHALTILLTFEWSFNPGVLIAGLFFFGLSFDLVIATVGYVFASRLLGTEVRSTDSTWSGWLVCMICYPPFVVIFQYVREQADDLVWTDWLLPDQPLYWVWAVMVAGSWTLYWFSNACFGLRFSNLTWRGLIAHGPYRFTKHPCYIGKNLYWWLHTVPFIGVGLSLDLLRNLLALSFVSLVYYLRAKTEERHLARFPEYAGYMRWMDRHGLLARCLRKVSWRRGAAPVDREAVR